MFTKRLTLLRKEKGLTKKEVAKFLKIDQSTYGKYELGKREPDYETLSKLADFYSASADYLLGRSDVRTHKTPTPQVKIGLDISGLPQEAVKQIEEYIEFVKHKYKFDK